jgi:hypothetical protein
MPTVGRYSWRGGEGVQMRLVAGRNPQARGVDFDKFSIRKPSA